MDNQTNEAEIDQALAAMGGEQPEVKFEETPMKTGVIDGITANPNAQAGSMRSVVAPLPKPDNDVMSLPQAQVAPVAAVPEPVAKDAPTGDLDEIRKKALLDLVPLLDRVDLGAAEKFDAYMLAIKERGDKSLLAKAYAAASEITDEQKKADALLEVVREIDGK